VVALVVALLGLELVPALRKVPNTLALAELSIGAEAPYLPFVAPSTRQQGNGGKPAPSPAGITAGPDGNLWFTELQEGMIGRITPTGAVKEFPLADPNSQLGDITVGPDGNLWFTGFETGKIGVLVTWLADRGVGARHP
jgi:hypothetical protein